MIGRGAYILGTVRSRFLPDLLSSVPKDFIHHHMTCGAARRLVPDVMDLYS
jgi:hypothetical protein